MTTYKTNHPAALAARQQYTDDVQALRAKAAAFRERFGAKDSVIQASSSLGTGITGFVFEPPQDRLLWTVPDHKLCGAQRPRASLAKATPELREQLKALRAEWDAHYPSERVSWEPLLASVGLSAGALFFSGAFKLFEHDGWLYLKTGALPKADHLVEILNSEYDAALVAHNKEKGL
jgi:hypothetical protein